MRLKNRVFSGNIYKLISLYLPMIINIPYIFLPIILIFILCCGENILVVGDNTAKAVVANNGEVAERHQ